VVVEEEAGAEDQDHLLQGDRVEQAALAGREAQLAASSLEEGEEEEVEGGDRRRRWPPHLEEGVVEVAVSSLVEAVAGEVAPDHSEEVDLEGEVLVAPSLEQMGRLVEKLLMVKELVVTISHLLTK
jgi:hypothetical protein